MENRTIKVYSQYNSTVAMKVIPGHFATNHSHVNYYIDMTTLKVRQNEASSIAMSMMREYVNNTVVDTIICMDGCEIIGSYLAEELTAAGFMSMNSHKSMYIISPEFNSNGQMIFRDNIQPMVKNKHVVLVLASATTGKTIDRAIECIEYYGGTIQGISSIFSAVDEVDGYPIHSIFKTSDLPEYATYSHIDCPLCKNKQKLDAIVNSYGYSKL